MEVVKASVFFLGWEHVQAALRLELQTKWNAKVRKQATRATIIPIRDDHWIHLF